MTTAALRAAEGLPQPLRRRQPDGPHALAAAAAEAVAENDDLGGGLGLDAVNGGLQLDPEPGRVVVEALLDDGEVDDVREAAGKVGQLLFEHGAGDDRDAGRGGGRLGVHGDRAD